MQPGELEKLGEGFLARVKDPTILVPGEVKSRLRAYS